MKEARQRNKENNNKHNLQKIHQSDKVETEQILDTYAMHNLIEWICKVF